MAIHCIFVAIGGALGATCRYLISQALAGAAGLFPLGTLLINLFGSFLIGVFTELSGNLGQINPTLSLMLTVGLCGGFTTFSTFSLETLKLIESGHYALATSYAFMSVFLCIIGVILGKSIIHLLNG